MSGNEKQTRLTNTLIYHSSEWLSSTIYGYAKKKGKDSYEHGSSFLFFLLFPCFLSLSLVASLSLSLLYTIKISRRRSQILVWHSDESMPVENRSSNNDADDDDADDTVITLRSFPLLGAQDRTVNASLLTPPILRVVGLPKKRQTERGREETDDGIIDYSCI